jgi:hypothetical protein
MDTCGLPPFHDAGKTCIVWIWLLLTLTVAVVVVVVVVLALPRLMLVTANGWRHV